MSVSSPRPHLLNVAHRDEPATKVFVEVRFAAYANAVGEEGIDVQAGRNVEIGER